MQVAIHYDGITKRVDGLILKADTFTDEQLFAVIENAEIQRAARERLINDALFAMAR